MRTALRHVGMALGAAFALALTAQPAVAQHATPYQPQCLSRDNTEGIADYCLPNTGFNLFANADYAGVGFRNTGTFMYGVTNEGPCERTAGLSGSGGVIFCMYINTNGATRFNWFQLGVIAGVPPSEWRKIKAVAPSAANVSGGGWAAMWGNLIGGLIIETGPADGTLGRLFSGAQSTDDGSCLDNTGFEGAFMATGIPTLPGSDCPVSWGSEGFLGPQRIPLESWVDQFNTVGAANFNFDYWRLPADQVNGGPLGSYSTYGVMSDYYTEMLARYGSAIPGGTGAPVGQGYPVGLEWRFEAYKFGLPNVANTVFWRATIVNRTEDVWGAGIDYDSLYLGLTTGTGGAPQSYSNYYQPWNSTAIFHENGVNPGCNGGTTGSGIQGCVTTSARGFFQGTTGIVVLKSPIGDLRNKQFSDPTSPFFAPAHPLAGDTITFNHGHQCGFGGCTATSWNVSDKRGFGMLSSQEDLVLDGRNPGAMSGNDHWRTFRSFNHPTTQDGRFNRYVPGNWDYNKDGIQDTLYFDTCHTNGCVVTHADTMPGGQVNGYGNIGGVMTAGPFPLAAGDTTTFWVAMIGAPDSIGLHTEIASAIELYNTFFFGPEAPPKATILSTSVTAASTVGDDETLQGQNPEISIFFSDDPERWTDPFLIKVADDIDAAPAGTPFEALRLANPTLTADIRTRAADNLASIEIYKSCDPTLAVFTSDNDCAGDPATDARGLPIGTGWEAYAIFDRATGADLANVFTDENVFPGRRHLYVLLARSRGATFLITNPNTLLPDTLTIAPQLANPLSRATSDPNVVSVYVPASRQAGFRPASFSVGATVGNVTTPLELGFSENVAGGSYRLLFGDRITVRTIDSAGVILGSRVIVEDTLAAVPATGGAAFEMVLRADTFTTSDPAGIPGAGTPSTSVATGTTPDTITTTYRATGFALVDGAGTPFFTSTALTGGAATPAGVFSRLDFPGFTLGFNNAGGFTTADERQISPTGDTIPRGTVNSYMPQWQEGASTATAFGRGRYTISWQADAYGLTQGIGLNLQNPAATQAEITAALESRPAALTGLTDAATAVLLGVPQSDLVPVRVPFTARNETFGRDVSVAMVRRPSNRILLGQGTDTVSVTVPEDEWVPGDVLVFIETVTRDSTIGANTVVSGGAPIQVTGPVVSFAAAVVGCNSRLACNPARPAGVNNPVALYAPLGSGWTAEHHYQVPATGSSDVPFTITPAVVGGGITAVTPTDLSRIRVVPNPFVVFSQYQENATTSRILFTGVPPQGLIRIYTVSGQFVQQIEWTQADLNGTGDLAYNLRSREGTDLATGLYLWVLTTDVGGELTESGKFVIIRGSAN